MSSKHQLQTTDSPVLRIRQALEGYRLAHASARIDVYRSNPACIRIRVIDPDFRDLDLIDREERLWHVLDRLPSEIRRDISVLLAITPEEMEFSGMNLEFEDRKPRDL